MSFAKVLAQAIELAENGFPLGNRLAQTIADSKKIRKYPTSVKIYLPNGRAPEEGEIFRNPDLARTLKKLVEAETRNAGRGRHQALKAARVRLIDASLFGAFGRIYLSGPEAQIDAAQQAAQRAIGSIQGRSQERK